MASSSSTILLLFSTATVFLLLLSHANAQHPYGGYQGGGGGYGGGDGGGGGQPAMEIFFVPVHQPGKNATIVSLGEFAVGEYNSSMRANLTFVDVLEAAVGNSTEGSYYLLALRAAVGKLARVFRADVFMSFDGSERLLNFWAVLA